MTRKPTNQETRRLERKGLKEAHGTIKKANLIRVGVEVELNFETSVRRLFAVATAVGVSLMAWLLPWSANIH